MASRRFVAAAVNCRCMSDWLSWVANAAMLSSMRSRMALRSTGNIWQRTVEMPYAHEQWLGQRQTWRGGVCV